MDPQVSVIIPTYNVENNVRTAIQSILNQTYENIEVIVVDDGSSDKTHQIVSSIDDERVSMYIRYEDPNGIPDSLNYGIDMSNGKYIARQDADDWSHETRIEKQVDYIEDNECDIVGTSCYNVNMNGDIIDKREVPENPDPTSKSESSHFVSGSILVESSCMKELDGFNEKYQTAEDVEFLTRCVNNGYEFQNITEPLYFFRIDENSTYRTDIRPTKLRAIHARNKDKINIEPEEFARLNDDELSDHIKDDRLDSLYRELSMEYLRFDKTTKSRYYAKKNFPSIMSLMIIMLSFMPTKIVSLSVRTYRYILNLRQN